MLARLVLVGDPGQIGAVNAPGGMFEHLTHKLGGQVIELTELHRFTHKWEAAATLRLRPRRRDRHRRCHRTRPGHRRDEVGVDPWPGRAPVLAGRGRSPREEERHPHPHRGRDPTERDRFRVLAASDTGGLVVADLRGRGTLTLPGAYLARHTEYGWAATIDGAQGATADIGILLARAGLDREHLYVAVSRGRLENHVHTTPELATGDAGPHHHTATPRHEGRGMARVAAIPGTPCHGAGGRRAGAVARSAARGPGPG